MASRPTAAAEPALPVPLAYPEMVAAYDRRTRAAYEVMGERWVRFLHAKNAYLGAVPGSREWYLHAERAYRLGLRSTHAYYLWTRGHTALALELGGGLAESHDLRLRLRSLLQLDGAPFHPLPSGSRSDTAGESRATTDHDEIRRWAEARGGRPARVRETGSRDDRGVLRIDFSAHDEDERLEEIPWEEWFEAFEENGLAFLYLVEPSGGVRSRFSKLVSR